MAKKDDELSMEKEKNRDAGRMREEPEESTGSKIVSVLIVIFIILIWLLIFIFAVKLDVGNFGSKVLAPVLKDVPVISAILPEDKDGNYYTGNQGEYEYDNLEEAIERIKELEMQLDAQSSTSGVDSSYIAELEAEISRLQVFEEQQEEFARQKEEFDEEVVYAEAAPDITEYQKFYEEMDPDNAAEIYRQVVEQIQYDQKVIDEAEKYANMEPASAAEILDVMSSADLDLVCGILSNMDAEQSGLIMQELDSNVAAKVTKRMLSEK